MQTKTSKKIQPDQSQMLSVDPNETILAASELPPYGTNHAVGTINFFFFLNFSPFMVDITAHKTTSPIGSILLYNMYENIHDSVIVIIT